jgi:hypothetical protein
MDLEGVQGGSKRRRDPKRAQKDPRSMAIPSLESERPKQIELFLNAQGPQVPKDPWPRQIHISEVENGCGDVESAHLFPVKNNHACQKDEGSGKNSECTSKVEVAQTDCGTALILGKENVRDQVTRQDKENADSKRSVTAEHFSGNVFPLHEMAQNHQGDGDGSKPVQRWDSSFAHRVSNLFHREGSKQGSAGLGESIRQRLQE